MKRLLPICLLLAAGFAVQASGYSAAANSCAENLISVEECPDTVCLDTIDLTEAQIPQIPLGQCETFTLSDLDARYGVVKKDGKYGIYDIANEMNVTRIAYHELRYATREEKEGEYYTCFIFTEGKKTGMIVVAESNNEFIAISLSDDD